MKIKKAEYDALSESEKLAILGRSDFEGFETLTATPPPAGGNGEDDPEPEITKELAEKIVKQYLEKEEPNLRKQQAMFLRSEMNSIKKYEDPNWLLARTLGGMRSDKARTELLKEFKENGVELGTDLQKRSLDPNIEGDEASGGIFVPQITEASILEKTPTFGQASSMFTSFPMGGNEIKMPKEGTLPELYWVGENQPATASKPTFGSFTMSPKKGIVVVVLSTELVEDANVNIGQYVIRKFAQVKGRGTDLAYFKGTGSPFTGLFRPNHTFGNNVYLDSLEIKGTQTLTYDKMLDMAYDIDQNYLANASWAMQRTIMKEVRKIKDENGLPIFTPANAGTPAQIFDMPVKLLEYAPTSAENTQGMPFMMLGDYSNSYIGITSGVQVQFLTEATFGGVNLAEYDLVAYKFRFREAFHVGDTELYSAMRVGNE